MPARARAIQTAARTTVASMPPPPNPAPPPVSDDELSQATGCAGVFNPDQVLDYHIEMADGDFQAMLADQTNSIYFPAQLACGDQAPITVGIRRKRSGGTVKVGLKIDMNEVVANTDSPIFKDNNYYYYDWYQGRVYMPWDLDTTMKGDFDVFAGGGGGGSDVFTVVLFENWEADYDAILTGLLANELPLDTVLGEIERAKTVAGDAFASDPYISGTAADAAESLAAYWTTRHAEVSAQVAAH